MAKPKGATSYRLSQDTQHLLNVLAERLGISKTGVVEMAVRKLARAELGKNDGRATIPISPAPLNATSRTMQN